MVQRKTLIKAAAVLITLATLAILFTQVNIRDIVTTLANINPIYLVAGFSLYFCTYFLRALRFHMLLNGEVGLKDLFMIVCMHNMVNNILPARTGEFSYVYLLKKVDGRRTTGEGLATLVVVRVFDFIMITVLFFISALFITDVPAIIQKGIWIVAIFMIGLIIVLIALLRYGRSFYSLVIRIFVRFHLATYQVGRYLLQKADEAVTALEKVSIRDYVTRIIFISLAIWGLNYSMVYLLLLGMDIVIPIQTVVLGATFTLLTSLLPIQGIAGFGTTESVWTLVFVPLGLTVETAIVSGFSYHILLLIFYLILGAIGTILFRFRR